MQSLRTGSRAKTARGAAPAQQESKAQDPTTSELWKFNQAGAPLSPKQFAAIVSDQLLPEIQRASAITQQAALEGGTSEERLQALLASDEPLVLLAAVASATNLPLAQREKLLMPLLTHELRALRVAAANQLRDSKPGSAAPLKSALIEADLADDLSSWRGEGALNKALHLERQGKSSETRGEMNAGAIAAYQHAIKVDPYFEPSYVNLAELFRRQGETGREQSLYTSALRALPNSSLLRYSYALHLVRQKKPAEALVETTKALAIDAQNQSNAYLHLLLHERLGKTELGVQWLRTHLEDHGQSPQVLALGAKQARATGDATSLRLFTQALQSLRSNQYLPPGQ